MNKLQTVWKETRPLFTTLCPTLCLHLYRWGQQLEARTPIHTLMLTPTHILTPGASTASNCTLDIHTTHIIPTIHTITLTSSAPPPRLHWLSRCHMTEGRLMAVEIRKSLGRHLYRR